MRRLAVHQGIPSPAPHTFDTSPGNVGNARTASLERQHDMFFPLAFEEGFDECPVEKNRRDGRVGDRRVRSGRGSGTGGVGGDRRDRVDDGDRRDRPAVVVVVQAGPHGPELALGRRPPRGPLGRAVWDRRQHRWEWKHQWRDGRYCAPVRTDGPPRQFDGPPRQFDGPPANQQGPGPRRP